MDWQAALLARVRADGPLTALIGTRSNFGERPQGDVLPAVVLQMIGDGKEQHLKGFHGLQPSRVQVDAYSLSHKEAWAVSNAALAAVVGGTTSNGHIFSRAMVELSPRDIPEPVTAADGQNKTIFRVSMDLVFHHAAASEEGS